MATHQKRDEHLQSGDDLLKAGSEQEEANQLFLQRVGLLPGVLRMEQHEDRISGGRSFRIYVRHGDRNTQYAVYGLEAEIYQLHPRTYLDVLVLAEADRADTDPDSQAATR